MRNGQSAFRFFGLIGFAMAYALAAGLARYAGLSLWIVTALAVSGAVAFLALAMVTKIVTGAESLTYYHHQTAVLLMAALVLSGLRAPLLPYLDIAVLGIGVFLVFGRIGCLKVGCCHGLPCPRGVRYPRHYLDSGFPGHLVEVALVPVQAVESLGVLGIVCLGTLQVITRRPPGSALSSYLVAYAFLRFLLEFFRGGTDRRFLWGFSEAQWTSLAIVCATVGLETHGELPFEMWHRFAVVAMALVTIALQFHPLLRFTRGLIDPFHIEELAQALELASDLAAEQRQGVSQTIHLAVTKMGVQISGGCLGEGGTPVRHYTLSRAGGAMSERTARLLAVLVSQLTRSPYPVKILPGRSGVYHLVFPMIEGPMSGALSRAHRYSSFPEVSGPGALNRPGDSAV
jgi:prolipoprotein diacylglyceryltransferase